MARELGGRKKALPGLRRTKVVGFAPKFTGMKPMEFRKFASKLKGHFREGQPKQVAFAICLDDSSEYDLTKGRVYKVIKDSSASSLGLVRVVDNTGEDYLYPRSDFRIVRLPHDVALISLRLG